MSVSSWQILIASSNLESRRALMRILNRQGLDPIAAANVAECHEVLQNERVGLIFCDSRLADGSYRDLLHMVRSSGDKARVVVTSKRANWDEYLEAIRLGAFDVITSPCNPTDVEWMVIQAKREGRNRANELLPRGGSAPLSRAAAS
jgi:two-component system, NtrC family, response regulator AtoC